MWLVDCGATLRPTVVDSTWSVVERGSSLGPKSYSEFDGSD